MLNSDNNIVNSFPPIFLNIFYIVAAFFRIPKYTKSIAFLFQHLNLLFYFLVEYYAKIIFKKGAQVHLNSYLS